LAVVTKNTCVVNQGLRIRNLHAYNMMVIITGETRAKLYSPASEPSQPICIEFESPKGFDTVISWNLFSLCT